MKKLLLMTVCMLLCGGVAQASTSAWVYANQPSTASYSPNPIYAYNPAGGPITIQRFAPGVYGVTFAQLVPMSGSGGNVQVTPYGNGTANCHVQGWGPSVADIVVFVRCYATNTGTNTDTEYTVLMTFN